MILGIVFIVLLVILIGYIIGVYNKLVKERNFVDEAFSTIDGVRISL